MQRWLLRCALVGTGLATPLGAPPLLAAGAAQGGGLLAAAPAATLQSGEAPAAAHAPAPSAAA